MEPESESRFFEKNIVKKRKEKKGLELGPNWRLTASSRLGYLEQDQKWVWLLEPDQN